ncbi:PilZ domain-containing protein [Acidobacteriota bacterium]
MQSTSHKRIIAADNSRIYRIILKDILEKAGHEIHVAKDGSETLTLVRQYTPHIDLLITDLMMPGMTGFDVIRKVRSELKLDKLPILVTTEFPPSSEDFAEVKRLGGDVYIPKSSMVEELLFYVNELLKPSPDERRSHLRVPVSIPINFEYNEKTYSTRTLNLSQNGCFVVGRDFPKTGSISSLTFWIATSPTVIKCQARVVWIRQPDDTNPVYDPPGIGFEFLDLQKDHSESLSQFVSDLYQHAFTR